MKVKITENDIKKMVTESVEKMISESKKEEFKKYYTYICNTNMSPRSLLQEVFKVIGADAFFNLVKSIYEELAQYDPDAWYK